MQRLSVEQNSYYLGRLKIFKRPAEIADMIGASRASVDRWVKNEGLPSAKFLPSFKRALKNLSDQLRSSAMPELADMLIEDPPPDHIEEDLNSTTRAVQRWLRKRLKGKTVRYQVIMSEAIELGYTRSQIQYASDVIKVKKTYVRRDGKVPGYSLWGMR